MVPGETPSLQTLPTATDSFPQPVQLLALLYPLPDCPRAERTSVSCCYNRRTVSECGHPRELHFLRERAIINTASPHPQEDTVCGLKAFSPQQFPSLGPKQQGEKGLTGALGARGYLKRRFTPGGSSPTLGGRTGPKAVELPSIALACCSQVSVYPPCVPPLCDGYAFIKGSLPLAAAGGSVRGALCMVEDTGDVQSVLLCLGHGGERREKEAQSIQKRIDWRVSGQRIPRSIFPSKMTSYIS